jgi:hypothetical protein
MCVRLVVDGIGSMARRLAHVPVQEPGPAVRAHLIDRAHTVAERTGHLPGSPALHRLARLVDRADPVMFNRWEVRHVWPDAQHGTRYYLDPDDSIREAVKDGDTWR